MEQTDARVSDGTILKDLVGGGVREALGNVRSEALVKDYTHMEGYKKLMGQRREAMGVVIAGRGELVGADTQTAYVDEREEWKGGSRLVRRYENGAVYTSLSVNDNGGYKVEMTSRGQKVDLRTDCDPWYVVNGWEPLLVANTPDSDLFLKGLHNLPNGTVPARIEETISLDGGTINGRRMRIDINLGWQGNRAGVDMHKAASLDYEFIKGGSGDGKDVAYARRGYWESASGILDSVSRQKAMQYIK